MRFETFTKWEGGSCGLPGGRKVKGKNICREGGRLKRRARLEGVVKKNKEGDAVNYENLGVFYIKICN
jgi:hypothetical protein